jgi:hypothetical protein
MAKQKKKKQGNGAATGDKQVKDSNELLGLIRQQMAQRRAGPESSRPKKLKIPDPE